MQATSSTPGAVIADRRVLDLLGSGGEGEVWRAERPDGTLCALKLVRPEVLPEPEEVRRRGRWLVRIDHHSLVRVTRGGRFTSGALAGWGFVEMDLIDGPSLQDVGPVPDALERLRGVAEALDLLHVGAWSDGVPLIHRDVKPGNLIGAPGGLVLVDPSTMRGLDSSDLTRVGTPAYLAPEVATGRFGPLVDVYGLAATATALLSGTRGAQLAQIVADPWAHPLPDGVRWALHPDPSQRPGTCAAVVDDHPVHTSGRVHTQLLPGDGRGGPRHGYAAHLDPLDHLDPADLDGGAAVPPPPAWPRAVLAAVLILPALTWALGMSRPSLVGADTVLAVGAIAAVVHLAVHLVTRRGVLGLLAPPWAWGDLVANRRSVGRKRTTWLADVVTGTVVLGAGTVTAVILADLAAPIVPVIAVAVVVLVEAWARLATTSRRAVWAPVWTVTLPIRLIGAIPRVAVDGPDR